MSYYEFKDEDIIHNTIKTHPECNFYFFRDNYGRARLSYNNIKNPIVESNILDSYNLPGEQNDEFHPPNISHVPYGFVELFGHNIARPFDTKLNKPDLITPFITKDSGLMSMTTVSTSQFNSDFAYGDKIEGLPVRAATISSQLVSSGSSSLDPNARLRDALRTTFGLYTRYSSRFIYHKGLADLDVSSASWEDETFRLLQIPSIFYGEKIKKGTVKLDWYDAGTLLGTLEDSRQNGELLVTYSPNPSEVGKFAGLIFYSEGFIILTNKSVLYKTANTPVRDHEQAPMGWIEFMKDLKNYKTKDNPRDDSDSTITVGDPTSYPQWTVTSDSGITIQDMTPSDGQGGNYDPHLHGVYVLTGPAPLPVSIDRLSFEYDDGKTYSLWSAGAWQDNQDTLTYVLREKTGPNAFGGVSDQVRSAFADFISEGDPVPIESDHSFNLNFKGTSTIPTMTMVANIEKTEGSHSNNPTFLDSDYTMELLKPARDPNTTALLPLLEADGTLTMTLEESHNLTTMADEYYELEIEKVEYAGQNPFEGLRLALKTTADDKIVKIYRVLSSGSYQNIPGELIDDGDHHGHTGYVFGPAATFSVKKNCYQKYKPLTGPFGYVENSGFKIKNTVKSYYNNTTSEYQDTTYISKIALYDEDRNLIGVAKLATPVKKTPDRDFTFKIKIDL